MVVKKGSQDHISKKSGEIPSFIVMDVLEKAQAMERAGENIIHMEVGEPDFDTPEPIKQAAITAINEGRTKYTHSLGLIELRKAIAKYMADEYSVEIEPDQALVTSGSSNALFLALGAILDAGDEVIMADPGYSCYPNFVSFLGGTPITLPVYESENFVMSPDRIKEKVTKRTRAIIVNSPSNPTGAVLSRDVMDEIANLGPLIISDEIYNGLSYEGRSSSMLEFTNNAIVIDGFSKRLAMTGWRLGYAIVPPQYLRPMQKMQQNFNISANSFVQWAGVAALKTGAPYVDEMRSVYNERRGFMVDGLRKIGLTIPHAPAGAFYLFVDFSHIGKSSMEVANTILEEAKVALTPGIDFGLGGEGFIRLSYANSMENLREGLRRLKRFLAQPR